MTGINQQQRLDAVVLKLALPIALSLALEPLCSMIDTYTVFKRMGPRSLSAFALADRVFVIGYARTHACRRHTHLFPNPNTKQTKHIHRTSTPTPPPKTYTQRQVLPHQLLRRHAHHAPRRPPPRHGAGGPRLRPRPPPRCVPRSFYV